MDVDGAMVTDDCDQTVVVDQDAAMDVEGAMVTDTGNVENFQNAENENGAGDTGKLDVEQEAEGHKDKEPMDDDKSNSVMPRTEITVPGPGTQPLPSESPNAPNAEINEISSLPGLSPTAPSSGFHFPEEARGPLLPNSYDFDVTTNDFGITNNNWNTFPAQPTNPSLNTTSNFWFGNTHASNMIFPQGKQLISCSISVF
jgi:hypothetical protein